MKAKVNITMNGLTVRVKSDDACTIADMIDALPNVNVTGLTRNEDGLATIYCYGKKDAKKDIEKALREI